MTFTEMKEKERWEVVLLFVCSKMICYNLKLEKVSMRRKKNFKGSLVADFHFYLRDRNDYLHIERHRVWDDGYLWMCSALTKDFPDIEFIDISPDCYKLVRNYD